MSKADYVRAAPNPGGHTCHWPGCKRQVPPAMWGCTAHWYRLPATIRAKIWRTFKPGQEISKTPSVEYMAAAREAEIWIAEDESFKATGRLL